MPAKVKNGVRYVHNPTRACSCTIKIEGSDPVSLSIVYCDRHANAYDAYYLIPARERERIERVRQEADNAR